MFALSSQPGRGFFLLVLSGELGAAEICSAHSFLAEMCRQTAVDVVLLDIMGASMRLSPEEVPRTRAHMEAHMPRLRRLAIAHKPEDDRGLVRLVAETLGIEYRQFTDLLAAERWASVPAQVAPAVM